MFSVVLQRQQKKLQSHWQAAASSPSRTRTAACLLFTRSEKRLIHQLKITPPVLSTIDLSTNQKSDSSAQFGKKTQVGRRLIFTSGKTSRMKKSSERSTVNVMSSEMTGVSTIYGGLYMFRTLQLCLTPGCTRCFSM